MSVWLFVILCGVCPVLSVLSVAFIAHQRLSSMGDGLRDIFINLFVEKYSIRSRHEEGNEKKSADNQPPFQVASSARQSLPPAPDSRRLNSQAGRDEKKCTTQPGDGQP